MDTAARFATQMIGIFIPGDSLHQSDALGIPFVLLFLIFLDTSRKVPAAIALGLGGLAKLYPLFLLPLLFRKSKKLEWAWLPGIPLLILAAGYLFYQDRSSGGMFESLAIFNSTFAFNGLFFSAMGEHTELKCRNASGQCCSVRRLPDTDLFHDCLCPPFTCRASLVSQLACGLAGAPVVCLGVSPARAF